MRVVRVGPLPDRAIEAAAEFYASVLPHLDPGPKAEGTHAQHGGGAPSDERHRGVSSPVPLPHPSGGSSLPVGEDLALVFEPASHDHRAWRLAAVQDLARAAAPARVNGVVGNGEQAIAEALAWLEQAPGVTGQLLSVENG